MQLFDYIFNVGGNYTATINGMTEATGDFSAKVESANNWVGKLSSTLAVVDLARNAFEQIDSAVKTFNASGITLDSQMHDLSAVAGVVGEDLKKIEGYARESAKAFGTDASVAVEGYKLLLGQLTPELAKCPEALKAMGESVQVTSKLMGNDGVAAAEVLTTAMNQYGVSLDDPMEASRKMAEMMNVMAAAGQEGSAELPAIKVALEQCGMAAKAANVSFEETNAAVQVLDKAGKKGSGLLQQHAPALEHRRHDASAGIQVRRRNKQEVDELQGHGHKEGNGRRWRRGSTYAACSCRLHKCQQSTNIANNNHNGQPKTQLSKNIVN